MVTYNGYPKVKVTRLMELASLYGVQPIYRSSTGQEVRSPPESVAAVLRSLGAELPPDGVRVLPSEQTLERAIRARKLRRWGLMLEPVMVAWDGVSPPLSLRLPGATRGNVSFSLTLEDGAVYEWSVAAEDLRLVVAEDLGRERYEERRVGLPVGLPLGYQRLRAEVGGRTAEATVISAPRRCWSGESWLGAHRSTSAEGHRGRWGLFAPVYALRTDRDWGAGDLADLGALAELASRWGGSAMATLPLLAGFLDKPFEPSPYRPVSRLFWNEFYLALDLIPEWRNCPAVRELWASPGVQALVHALRASELVDYREVARLKREVLEEMARFLFASEDLVRKESLASYLDTCGNAREYARFRAEVENHGSDWRDWPQRWEKSWPSSSAGEVGPWPASQSERYHLYCQWQMEEQLSNLAKNSGVAGLFLDLPVGVHPGGFDTWRWPGLFVHDMSAGAPPDRFFSLGQHWDSPPLHPEKTREDGHRYFAGCVRHHMRHAAYLRIDHAMSLHRLFLVPLGAPPASGVYVDYPAEELYSVLSLESHRNRTVVVGEDLGTVPQGVRTAMRRHGVSRTWVVQMSFRARGADPVPPVPSGAVASLNTHDMFPLAGFVEGDDIRVRLETGQVDEAGARREAAARVRLVARLRAWAEGQQCDADLLGALLKHLRRSPAGLTLVNLEDLLLETRPQNVPGTGPEWGNWRRKARQRLPKTGEARIAPGLSEEDHRWRTPSSGR